MFDLKDALTIEEGGENEMEYFASIQAAINSLHAWKMQGSMGRAMMGAMDAGRCMLGLKPTHDYWGNRIPSRDEVKAGTKGSYDFVVEHYGSDWANTMRSVS